DACNQTCAAAKRQEAGEAQPGPARDVIADCGNWTRQGGGGAAGEVQHQEKGWIAGNSFLFHVARPRPERHGLPPAGRVSIVAVLYRVNPKWLVVQSTHPRRADLALTSTVGLTASRSQTSCATYWKWHRKPSKLPWLRLPALLSSSSAVKSRSGHVLAGHAFALEHEILAEGQCGRLISGRCAAIQCFARSPEGCDRR